VITLTRNFPQKKPSQNVSRILQLQQSWKISEVFSPVSPHLLTGAVKPISSSSSQPWHCTPICATGQALPSWPHWRKAKRFTVCSDFRPALQSEWDLSGWFYIKCSPRWWERLRTAQFGTWYNYPICNLQFSILSV